MGSKVHGIAGRLASEKIKLVIECNGLKDEKLGEFLRKNGIYSSELDLWREQMRDGLEAEVIVPPETRKYFRDKIKKLEADLSEALAVIEAQKKVRKLLDEEVKKNPVKLKKKLSK